MNRARSLLMQRRMMRTYKARLVCRRGITRICIEGFPRSANSFAVRLFRSANDVPVAHHTHSTDNIQLALDYGIPVLILIREPIHAIASACIYQKRGVDEQVDSWISFYKWVERVRHGVVLADFEQVIRDFNWVIRSVNGKFATEFNLIRNLEATKQKVFEAIQDDAARRGKGFERIPIPSKKRQQAKAEYVSLLSRHPEANVAQALYARIRPERPPKWGGHDPLGAC